jgi:hypothetical protein
MGATRPLLHKESDMNRRKMLLPLAALLCALGLGMSADSRTVAPKPAQAVRHADCCADFTCPPGCAPDCPPDCCGITVKTPRHQDCPPCPFCP